MPLTDKQVKFCDEYLVDLNATQAAIRAGYSPKTANRIASENLTKLDISAYIQNKRKELSAATNLTPEWVLNRFKEISDRCMTAEPVMIRNMDGELEESGEYTFDSSGANKATEMIGKHLGLFEKDNNQKKPETVILNFIKTSSGHKAD